MSYRLFSHDIASMSPRATCILCILRQSFRFSFYFTEAHVKCCVAAVECLPLLHNSADYTFISFGIIGPLVVSFKNEVLLMYTLEGISSVANFISTYEESQ